MADVGNLDVSATALRAQATLCDDLAAELGGTPAPGCPAHAHQSTTAAVAAVHGAVDVTRTAMGTRMRSTAASIRTAAMAFDDRESASAVALRALTE